MKNADVIRAAIECGFPTHEGDPSMLDFANRIAHDARQNLKAELQADGWRQCAKGQNTSQFCGHLEKSVKELRIENEQLKAERNQSGVELRKAVSKAVREERESCAKACDALQERVLDRMVMGTPSLCAKQISAGGSA